MSADDAKRNAAIGAIKYVERGMTLGLGTGSTAAHFVNLLKPLVAQGYDLKGVPTSEATRKQAQGAGIEIIEPDETTRIDLAVDGADEADPEMNLIKGGGGALLREKIVAGAARKFVVIADKSKRVTGLGKFPLPVEIDTFGWAITVRRIRETLGAAGYASPALALRHNGGAAFISDGGNLIVDCQLERITAPAALDASLTIIPGVIETGLFCGITDVVIYGDEDGVKVTGG